MQASEAKQVVQRVADSGAHRGQSDQSRSASYRAEDRAFGGSAWGGPQVPQSEIQEWAELVAEWARCEVLEISPAYFYKPNTRLHNGGGATAMHSFRTSANVISFPAERSTMSVAIILHEVAHYLTPDDVGHGDAWRAMYLALVREFMGAVYADRLSHEFATAKKRRSFRLMISFDKGATWAEFRGKQKDLGLSARYTTWMRGGPKRVCTWNHDELGLIQLRMEEK